MKHEWILGSTRYDDQPKELMSEEEAIELHKKVSFEPDHPTTEFIMFLNYLLRYKQPFYRGLYFSDLADNDCRNLWEIEHFVLCVDDEYYDYLLKNTDNKLYDDGTFLIEKIRIKKSPEKTKTVGEYKIFTLFYAIRQYTENNRNTVKILVK